MKLILNTLSKFNTLKVCLYVLGLMASSLANAQTLSQSPLEESTYVAPNIMLSLDNTHSMVGSGRMPVLKTTAKQLINSGYDVNWCTSDLHFDSNDFVTAECGATQTALNVIDALEPDPIITGNPLANSFYEITKYFRGMGVYQGKSPVKYRCQSNYAIMITDGYPTYDATMPAERKSDHGLTGTETLPDWDGLKPVNPGWVGQSVNARLARFKPLDEGGYDEKAPPFSDGLDWDVGSAFVGGNLFLDDLALFGKEIDLFRTGNDSVGKPFGDATDPDDPGDFPHQNIITHTIGFEIDDRDNQMLKDAAAYGGGLYSDADDATQLSSVFDNILENIVRDSSGSSGSAAATTATSSFLSGDDQVFQVKYDSTDWSGSLISHRIDSNTDSGTFGEITDVLWDTDKTFVSINSLPPTRNILTVNSETGLPVTLNWDNLSDSQKAYLGNDVTVLDYLKGNQSKEVQNGGNFRDRSTLLGDIVHSAPVYVAAQDFYYDDPTYEIYRESIEDRSPIVYVGGNDGFLHGFHAPADNTDNTGGTETFAFMPQSVFPMLSELTSPDYSHRYYIDGTPTVVDAQIEKNGGDQEWRTVLLSPMGAGSEGLFALDVTDPSLFTDLDDNDNANDIFLWEINNRLPQSSENARGLPEPDYPYMGHLIDRPSIIRLNTGSEETPQSSWYAITGNGVHSEGGKAVFYQIDLTTGELPSGGEIILDHTEGNGIVSNTAVDIDGDDFVDRVYLTDIKGHIWRLDWDIGDHEFKSFYTDPGESGKAIALFNATVTTAGDTGEGNPQPITSAVEVTRVPGDTGALMLHVGTGKFYDTEDAVKRDPEPKRSFYGVVDRGDNTDFSTLNKSNLVKQTILEGTSGSKTARTIQSIDDVGYYGWFMDLPTDGERVVAVPLTIKDRILFTTLIPFHTEEGESDPCINQTSGWLMEVDALTGSSPDTVTFDANQDGSFNDDDLVVVDSGIESTYAAGIQPSDGAPLSPSIIRVEKGDGSDGVLKGILSDSTGGSPSEFIHQVPPVERTSWRRLKFNY